MEESELNPENFTIILDIDGVICPYYSPHNEKNYMEDCDKNDEEHHFKESSIVALNFIIDSFSADVCMVSSWNNKFKDEHHYKNFLNNRGIKIHNLIIGDHFNRYNYVKENILNGNLVNYLIIDDECHGYYEECFVDKIIEYKRILKTDRCRCLDKFDAEFYVNWLKT